MSAELYSTIKIIFSLLDSSLTEADEKRVGKMVYERARLELRREVLMGNYPYLVFADYKYFITWISLLFSSIIWRRRRIMGERL